MSSQLPSQDHIRELISLDFLRVGYEIEDIRIETHPTRSQITIIADGDIPLGLDQAAQLSTIASTYLDALDISCPYVLEVSSPGISRPLTTRKHFQRNRGRKADIYCRNDTTISGRIAGLDNDDLVVVVRQAKDFVLQKIPLTEIIQAIVQVEFSTPSVSEMQLVAQQASNPETESGA